VLCFPVVAAARFFAHPQLFVFPLVRACDTTLTLPPQEHTQRKKRWLCLFLSNASITVSWL
jgi:hypothetical protein